MAQTENTSKTPEAIDPEKLKATAKQVADIAAEFIKKHPLESVGAALALGLVAGLLINRK
jgi:ElaB/YqjD/DUF883 family membrane-anchored ribosome-binding protein